MPPPEPPFDAAELARVLWRRKWLLALPWATALAVGVAAAFLLPPMYFSGTLLLLDRGQSMQGPLGTLSGGPEIEQQADIMREQVQSSLFLKSVISASGLAQDPATRERARRHAADYPGAHGDDQVEAYLVDELRDAIQIKRSKGNLFQVIVADVDPDRARKLSDAVSNQFVISSKARQLEALEAQQEFSSEQIQVYKRRLDEAEARLEAARRSAITSTISGSAVTQANYTFAQSLVEQANLELEDQRGRLTDLKGQFAGKLRDNDPALLSSPEVTRLVAELDRLENGLGRALLAEANLSGGAGVRLSMARKTGDLEAALQANAARALPNATADARDLAVRYRIAQADLAAKQDWQAWITSQVSAYERQVESAPNRDLDVTRLQSEVDQARMLYSQFQAQASAAQIGEAFQNAKLSGRFVVMEPATRPLSPGKPNRPLLVLLAFLVGGVLGTGSVLIAERHDTSMKNADEVEHLLGLPVLGAIPRVEELQRSSRRRPGPAAPGALPAPRDPGLLQRLKVESPLGLEFKRIYLNLARARGRTLPRTLLITSGTRGEGKTTTSACLGITLAREHRQRTLLVDFDLRSPALHRALGLPGSSWGLAQMLASRQFDERFVRQTALPNLDFLAAGRSERPAAELVDEPGVEWFLGEASNRYELIVVDAAPNLAVPDPLILGRAVEGVLYVIKAGATARRAAEYGVKVQRGARDNLLGVLLNDAGDFLPQYYGYKAQYYGYTTEAAEG